MNAIPTPTSYFTFLHATAVLPPIISQQNTSGLSNRAVMKVPSLGLYPVIKNWSQGPSQLWLHRYLTLHLTMSNGTPAPIYPVLHSAGSTITKFICYSTFILHDIKPNLSFYDITSTHHYRKHSLHNFTHLFSKIK